MSRERGDIEGLLEMRGSIAFPTRGTEDKDWESREAASTVGSAQHSRAPPRREPGAAAPGGARLL